MKMAPMHSPQPEAPITVLIADDHPLLRQGLRTAITAESDLQVIAEAANGEEALQQIVSLAPHVAILDIDMPRCDGFAVMRELNRLGLTVGVIVLTLHTGTDLLEEALEIGVRGYFLKSSAAIDIAEGIRRVANGDSYFSREVQQLLREGTVRQPIPAELAGLTPVEVRLVQQIASGKTSREIAAFLNLSARTIENYRTAICGKLNLTGPNALLRYALSKRAALRRL
ncbi:response regulator transcription factor [Acidobacteria bacterium AB60]|nr:response regulator transcription factor [Acidobacteria bacterium AB60]